MNDFILIAVTDPLVLPEATHAAAATGREVAACDDPRDIARHAARAGAIVADASTASHIGALRPAAPVYFLAPDPGPIDFEAALRAQAARAFLVPAEADDLVGALGANAATPGPRVSAADGLCLAVVGAAGGVGTSTLAAALARAAQRSGMRHHAGAEAPQATALIDAAPAAGGLDLLLGIEDAPGARWPDLSLGSGSVDAADVRRALPTTTDGIAVLSGARATVAEPFALSEPALESVASALRGDGLVVVDGVVPAAADHAVIVTAAEVRSAAAAAQWTHRLGADGVPASVVVRHRGWSSLAVEDVERVVHADVVAELPTVRGLPRAVENTGLPRELPRPLARACARVLEDAGWVR